MSEAGAASFFLSDEEEVLQLKRKFEGTKQQAIQIRVI